MTRKSLLEFMFILLAILALPPAAAETNIWQPLAGPTGGSVAALAISPDYANDLTIFAGLRGQGVYRAYSDTTPWQSISPNWRVVDLAISPEYPTDKTIVALTGLWTTGYTVHRSTDRGDTWETAVPPAFPDAQGLAVSPNFANDQTIYLYGPLTYLSTDGGATFAELDGWFAAHNINTLAFSPNFANDQTLFALVPSAGLYRSVDGGLTWAPTSLTGSFAGLAVSPDFANDQALIVTDSGGQLHLSGDGGANWTTPPLVLGAGGRHTLRFSPTFAADRVIMAASSADPGPYRSQDGGLTWAEAGWYDPGASYQNGMIGGAVFDLALAPNQDWSGAAYAATSIGVARSASAGASWHQRNRGLPTLTTRALAAAPGDPGLLLAGASFHENMRFGNDELGEYDGSLLLSTNGGIDWRTVTGRLDPTQEVAFSPDFANDATAFAVTGLVGQHGYADGAVLRSTDGGQNWEEVLGDLAFTALAVSPDFANDKMVWTSASAYSSSLGIYRSVNGGDSWTAVAPSLNAQIIAPSSNFAVDQVVFAGTAVSGLQKSTDGGLTWTGLGTPPLVAALALSPAYGASQTLVIGAQANAGEPGTIYRSTDGGATWEQLDTGIPASDFGQNVTIADLTFGADGAILAGARYGDAGGAVYRSADGGASWQMVGDGLGGGVHALLAQHDAILAGVNGGLRQIEVAQAAPAEPGTWISGGPRGSAANALAVSPNFVNDRVAFAGEWRATYQGTESGLGFLKSVDGGQTWAARPDPRESAYNGTAVHSYAFSPNFAGDGIAFAATGGGVFQTSDYGENWRWLGSPDDPPGWLGPIAAAPDFPSSGHIMTGASFYNDALYLSRDGGQTWARDDTASASAAIVYSPDFAADQTVFTAGNGLFKTSDNGLTWTKMLTTPLQSLVVSPQFNVDNALFAGGYGDLFVSDDGGDSWTARAIAAEVDFIYALAVSPDFTNDRMLFAGTEDGLYWSADGGVNWQLSDEYEGTAVLSLAISPGWPADPTLLVGTYDGVYRMLTANPSGGGNVGQPAQGFAPLIVSSLALSPDERLLLAGTTHHGLYGSGDGGQTWKPMGKQGSGYYTLVDAAVSPAYNSDQTIFIAQTNMLSIGSGLYRTTDSGQNWTWLFSTDSIGGIAISPDYAADQTVYTASNERAVERSTDGGDTWSVVGDWPIYNRGAALQLVLPPNYPTDGTIFVGGRQGFWRLLPGATLWETAVSGLTENHYILALAISPSFAADKTLLAAASWSDLVTYQTHYGLFRSTDRGANWVQVGAGLPDEQLTDVTISPYFAIDRMAYAVTAVGDLYRSRDGGQGWTLVGSAPERPGFRDVVVNRNGDVFVSSDSGVWQYATPSQNILINAGFEADGGWEMPVTRQTAVYAGEIAYEGRQSARIGIVNGGNKYAYSSVRQTIALPANTTEATLTLRAYSVTGETAVAQTARLFPPHAPFKRPAAAVSGDAQYGLILDPDSGAILDTIFWELRNAQSWQSFNFDLRAYAGQTIMLHIGVYNDGLNGQTGLYLDNAALTFRQTSVWPNQVYLPLALKE